MELQNVRRLAVLKLRNIGDVLMITPVLRALRESFPEARICVVVNAGTEAMLAHNPHIDEVLVYQRGRGLGYELGFLREFRSHRFDLTIGFTEGERTAWYSLLSGARFRFGRFKSATSRRPWAYTHLMPPMRAERHEVENHFDILAAAGMKLRNPVPRPLCLIVPDDLRAWARTQLAPLRPAPVVHVHPVSRWLWKCWEPASMAAILDWLHTERGARAIVTTGPAEREREMAREIVRLCRSKPLFFDGNLSLTQMAALSAESNGYFGVDTAPMHMAAAVGVPVVALFGPTNAVNWGPWTPRGRVLSKPCACNAASGAQKCDWSRTRACLAAITPAEAQAALDEMLSLDTLRHGSVV